jgi:hypothetical protein
MPEHQEMDEGKVRELRDVVVDLRPPEELRSEQPPQQPEPQPDAPPQTEPPKKGALHIERGHLEIRLGDYSFHEIRLADLSAKGDPVPLLLYAMVLQLFDVTRALAAVAHNAGAGTQLLARMEAAARQHSSQDAVDVAARTMDQLFDTFERRTGHKIRR